MASVADARSKEGFCAFPHSPIAAVPARDSVLLRVQRLVNHHANAAGEDARDAAAGWFSQLGRMIEDVAVSGLPEQLDGADELVRQGFVDWCATQDRRPLWASLDRFGVDVSLTAALMRLAWRSPATALGWREPGPAG